MDFLKISSTFNQIVDYSNKKDEFSEKSVIDDISKTYFNLMQSTNTNFRINVA